MCVIELVNYLSFNKGEIIEDNFDWINDESQKYKNIISKFNINDIDNLIRALNLKDTIRYHRLFNIFGINNKKLIDNENIVVYCVSQTYNTQFNSIKFVIVNGKISKMIYQLIDSTIIYKNHP